MNANTDVINVNLLRYTINEDATFDALESLRKIKLKINTINAIKSETISAHSRKQQSLLFFYFFDAPSVMANSYSF